MKLKDAVNFVQHNGCSCHASDVEHIARIVLQDGSSREITREVLEKYKNAKVLKVNVDIPLESYELKDHIVYFFYLDI